jgi:hypothetical protein
MIKIIVGIFDYKYLFMLKIKAIIQTNDLKKNIIKRLRLIVLAPAF